MKYIQAKSILSPIKEDPFFGLSYSMNLYRGCQHQCIYCDSRSTCYGIKDFTQIEVKENALALLEKELHKKKKGTIGTGSMNDCYMPLEKELGMTRRALEIIAKHKFPVHVLTKSDYVTRDIDLLKEISNVYAAVSFTVTAASDGMSSKIEPCAPVSSRRFAAVKRFADENIYTGIILTPVLPYITDTEDNIGAIVEKAADAGAKYILCWTGMTIREGQREYFYEKLDGLFPGLKEKYIERYGNSYGCSVPDHEKLEKAFKEECRKHDIATRMKFYVPGEDNRKLSEYIG
jgi:DNA repair photolyase